MEVVLIARKSITGSARKNIPSPISEKIENKEKVRTRKPAH